MDDNRPNPLIETSTSLRTCMRQGRLRRLLEALAEHDERREPEELLAPIEERPATKAATSGGCHPDPDRPQ